MSKTDLTVYYDGACPLCMAEIGHYKSQSGAERICFVDASRDEMPEDLDRNTALGRFHARKPDGTLVSGAEGFAEIWCALPKWKWAARLAAIPGMLWIMERLYRGFLPVRPYLSRAFGRWQSRRSSKRTT
jgi:predicted DCC family thiol-disulfide oxidoreductase YuxK